MLPSTFWLGREQAECSTQTRENRLTSSMTCRRADTGRELGAVLKTWKLLEVSGRMSGKGRRFTHVDLYVLTNAHQNILPPHFRCLHWLMCGIVKLVPVNEMASFLQPPVRPPRKQRSREVRLSVALATTARVCCVFTVFAVLYHYMPRPTDSINLSTLN